MLNSALNTTSLPFLEQLAKFGEHRHMALMSNIANIDTPNYKMRDLPVASFQQALEQAVSGETGPPAAAAQAAANPMKSQSIDALFPHELFEVSEAGSDNITFHDNNNRSVETLSSELLKNTMMQNFAVELMRVQFNMLQTAISERP